MLIQDLALIKVLQALDRPAYKDKASQLIQLKEIPSTLAFRSLQLNAEEAEKILEALALDQKLASIQLESLSFSNNPNFGDRGARAFSTLIIPTLDEIGLVNCGIQDAGGRAILQWMKQNNQLRMVCIENNQFSKALQLAFREFQELHKDVLLII
jgi:hypothetical protein